jgi:hypothetical protein
MTPFDLVRRLAQHYDDTTIAQILGQQNWRTATPARCPVARQAREPALPRLTPKAPTTAPSSATGTCTARARADEVAVGGPGERLRAMRAPQRPERAQDATDLGRRRDAEQDGQGVGVLREGGVVRSASVNSRRLRSAAHPVRDRLARSCGPGRTARTGAAPARGEPGGSRPEAGPARARTAPGNRW